MKLTLGELQVIEKALNKIIAAGDRVPMKIRIRNSMVVEPMAKFTGQIEKARVELIKKLGKAVEGKEENGFYIPKEDMEANQSFVKEMNDVMLEEVEFPVVSFTMAEVAATGLDSLDIINLQKFGYLTGVEEYLTALEEAEKAEAEKAKAEADEKKAEKKETKKKK